MRHSCATPPVLDKIGKEERRKSIDAHRQSSLVDNQVSVLILYHKKESLAAFIIIQILTSSMRTHWLYQMGVEIAIFLQHPTGLGQSHSFVFPHLHMQRARYIERPCTIKKRNTNKHPDKFANHHTEATKERNHQKIRNIPLFQDQNLLL
jgi:hypothetical protein